MTPPAESNRARSSARTVRSVVYLLIVGLVIVAIFSLLLPRTGSRPWSDEARRKGRLTNIGYALIAYSDEHGHFPASGEGSTDAKPVSSWRVSLLSHLEAIAFHDSYDFSQPWNAPDNQRLVEGGGLPIVYSTAITPDDRAVTDVVAITGKGTMWDESVTHVPNSLLKDVIVVVQLAESDITWMEPRDLSLAELKRMTASSPRTLTISDAKIGPLVLLSSGRVRKLPDQFPLADFIRLATVDGASAVSWEKALEPFADSP